jgi:hypothetical protein
VIPAKYGFVLLLAAAAFAVETLPTASQLIAHEWGTFTSVADLEGNPVQWMALGGPKPLPCFVYHGESNTKVIGYSTVRMETPVIYFYAPRKVTLSVQVDFLKGSITEWYPDATTSRIADTGRIQWRSVDVLPGESPELPTGKEPNHYYAARATDAAPLAVGKEREGLLFYRGMGDMDIPVRPRYTKDGKLELRAAGPSPAEMVIVFENRGGKIGYRVAGELKGVIEVDPPQLNRNLADLRRDLAASLVKAGLYPKEAAAMIETWRDSWFEEGTRVLYLMPRDVVDRSLPLAVKPSPTAIERVFVGRVEVLSPATRREIETAQANHDVHGLLKYGRYLQPFWKEIERSNLGVPAGNATNNYYPLIAPAPCAR